MRSKALAIASLLVSGVTWSQTQDNLTVSGNLSDMGQPVSGGLAILRQLRSEDCAKLLGVLDQHFDVRAKENPSPKEWDESKSCARIVTSIDTDENGNYSYSLSPGWYDVRFLWLMREPPATSERTVCPAGGWMVVFDPAKDPSGKYNGFAQGKPFKLKAKKSTQINFAYRDQIKDNPNCSFPSSGTGLPPDPRETEDLAEGSRLYLQRNYAAAVKPYQKVLDMEKQRRRLSPNFFRVLVDNLGMAYGISGKLKQAEETFTYGISQDPEYPLFHYNLACTYAEMNNKEESKKELALAYQYQANMIAGETFPDPIKDDSFRNFVKDESFVKFVRALQKPSR